MQNNIIASAGLGSQSRIKKNSAIDRGSGSVASIA
jgi:hypothetical protein